MDINVLVTICMFSHWTEVFPCKQTTASSVAKILLANSTPTWEPLLNCTVMSEPILSGGCSSESVLLGWFSSNHCANHSQSGFAELTSGTTETQLVKRVETLQLSEPTAPLLLALNFRSTRWEGTGSPPLS